MATALWVRLRFDVAPDGRVLALITGSAFPPGVAATMHSAAVVEAIRWNIAGLIADARSPQGADKLLGVRRVIF